MGVGRGARAMTTLLFVEGEKNNNNKKLKQNKNRNTCFFNFFNLNF